MFIIVRDIKPPHGQGKFLSYPPTEDNWFQQWTDYRFKAHKFEWQQDAYDMLDFLKEGYINLNPLAVAHARVIPVLYGLSLQYCVNDIVDGIVEYDSVEQIITSTEVFYNEWDDVIEDYSNKQIHRLMAWGEKEFDVFWQLVRGGKIYQPRCHGQPYPNNIASGWWVGSIEQISWEE